MIHTTGDFEYQRLVEIKPSAIEAGIEAIQGGCRIVTDTQMAFAGINKRALEKANCRIDCYIAHDGVRKIAEAQGTTRAMAAVDFALQGGVDIFVIGNAPTALFRLAEHIEQTGIAPELVIGVPVGFVGAAESKEAFRKLNVPSITTIGTKGGSNVAAAIMNAIIYMAVGRE
ncbi:precorrin-8X methylmutase [Candidatus Moduliflexus flocculans]|uniref:Precorrin-8X methylmutase n=1 Tax=Candidatus Moduliflexus flocculans TaxID=1499966 RepID=A0A081BR26_9BACT|nr:precorrin-8X methylmutase [Candidatus Moduliflexus flocculans]